MTGKTVKIFLADGTPSGLIIAGIINWTGKIFVAPRSQPAKLASRSEIKKTGIYFLIGSDPEDPSQEKVYIGESDNVWHRLTQHSKDSDKDFWEKTIVVTSTDDNLTKAHALFLESKLIQVSRESKRASALNGTNPESSGIPESDRADMDYFFEQIQLVLPVLGYSFATPLPSPNPVPVHEQPQEISPLFSMKYDRATANAQEINEEFVILKGSLSRKRHTPTLADSYILMRKNLVEDRTLIDGPINGYWIFTRNVPFKSPSTAANIVGGAQLNGRMLWKLKDSTKTYADWFINKTEAADINSSETTTFDPPQLPGIDIED